MRLDRFLANMGYGSRTEIKIALKRCQIKLNGKIVKKPDIHIDVRKDEITFDDLRVVYEPFLYVMLNKPDGYISATEDPKEPTVLALLEDRHRNRGLFPAGRLDKDTEGLLLLTDDGKLAHALLSPKKHVSKLYEVHCKGPITPEQIHQLEAGIELEPDFTTQPAIVTLISQGETAVLHLTIYEGKFHQIKRMLLAVDSEVLYLKRLAMGPLQLDPKLALGTYRPLTDEEMQLLRQQYPIASLEGETL